MSFAFVLVGVALAWWIIKSITGPLADVHQVLTLVSEKGDLYGGDGEAPLLIALDRTVDPLLEQQLQIAPKHHDVAVQAEAHEERRRLLLVKLGGETAAIAAESIDRVVNRPVVTRLRSDRSPWLIGAADVGGRVLAVCDVRSAFGSENPEPATQLVLLRDPFGNVTMALAVDAVENSMEVDADRIEPFGFARTGPATGVVCLPEGRIASMLEPEALLGVASMTAFTAGAA